MPDDDLISYDELFDAIENDPNDNQFKTEGQLLMDALNDWPTSNFEPSDLVAELRNEIKSGLTFDKLNSYCKTLTADKDAWKMEAMASILEMFKSATKASTDRSLELQDIIAGLTKHYRQKRI